MPSNLQTNQSNSTELRPMGFTAPLSSRQSLSPQEVIAQNAIDAVGLQKYQFISDNPKFYMCIGVQKYARINAMQVAKGNSLAQIILPMPMQLGDTQSVEYTPTDLGVSAAITVGTLSSGYNALMGRDTSMGGQEAYASNLGMAAGGVAALALQAAGNVADVVSGQSLSGQVSAITGLSINNFQVLLLRGPTFKKYGS